LHFGKDLNVRAERMHGLLRRHVQGHDRRDAVRELLGRKVLLDDGLLRLHCLLSKLLLGWRRGYLHRMHVLNRGEVARLEHLHDRRLQPGTVQERHLVGTFMLKLRRGHLLGQCQCRRVHEL